MINTNTKIKHNRQGIVIKDARQKEVATDSYSYTSSKENEKIKKYIDLASIIRTEHKITT